MVFILLEFQIAKRQNRHHQDWRPGAPGHEESLPFSLN